MKKQEQKVLKYSEDSNRATLWQFKNVVNSGDVRYLLILDDYTELPDTDLEPLESAWASIYSEFSDIVGGNRADLWLMRQKQTIAQNLELDLGLRVLSLVEKLRIQESVDICAEAGIIIDLDNFEQSFTKARAKMVRLKNKLKFAEKDKPKEESKEDLDGLIIILEKHQGYQFDEYTMTVKKFANIYKNYKASVKAQNNG